MIVPTNEEGLLSPSSSTLPSLSKTSSPNKSILLSKSSSDAIITVSSKDTGMTSVEGNKLLQLPSEQNDKEISIDNVTLKTTHTSITTNTPRLHDTDAITSSNLQLPTTLSHSEILQSTIKPLSDDNDNFKVSVAMDEPKEHTDDRSSTRSSTSSTQNIGFSHLEISDSIHRLHSYRILADPNFNNKSAKSIGPTSISSNVGLVSKSDCNTCPIPLPHSDPLPVDLEMTCSHLKVKNNTFPRSAADNQLIQLEAANQERNNSKSYHNHHSHKERSKFQSISTIRIPDNYQKTELALTKADNGLPHGFSSDPRKKQRASKTQSLIHASRKKVKLKADDLYNIPGQSISEDHGSYAIVYDLVTGIRFSVSRCTKIQDQITDQNFNEVVRMIFNREGNNQAPPTKYEFKFKDYAPEVFRDLRRMFNVNQADYLMSLNDEIGIRAVGSSGKSGSSFYYSNDRKFIIKTIHRSEHRHLRRVLKDYYYYVKKNPNTLLCQFYGLHRLKMSTRTGTVKVHVLVMNNLLPLTVNISECYDLKGSTQGRYTSKEKQQKGSCQKDLNFLENHVKIHLSSEKRVQFETQLKQDVALLKRLNIMDYSLLLGLRHINKNNNEVLDEEFKRVSQIVHKEVPGAHKSTITDTDGGILAVDPNGNDMDLIYYVGIIDCLTNYSTLKKLETFFRTLKHRRESISAIPPIEYGDRFLRFITSNIESPGIMVPPKHHQGRFRAFKRITAHGHTA